MNKKDKSIKDDNDVLSEESLNGKEKDLENNNGKKTTKQITDNT